MPFLVLLILMLSCLPLSGQLVEIPIEQRMAVAQVVVEGKVVRSHSFYGDNGRIYTRHVLQIDKVMKGLPLSDTLEIILEGGTVGSKSLAITHHLVLRPGCHGLFFLIPLGARHPSKLGTERLAYDVYASMQGFVQYLAQPGGTLAVDPFLVYGSIESDLYPILGWKSGGAPVLHKDLPLWAQGGPIIDSIRPLDVTAGTRTTLSIYGRGFQAVAGSVHFPDANLGGTVMMVGDTSDVEVWTDSLIQLWVPSYGPYPDGGGTAGTGKVAVQTALGDTVVSFETLFVRYAISNRRTEDTTIQVGISRFLSLFDQEAFAGSDTSGGYTFHFTDGFSANDSAEAVFRQAIIRWRCATGVNFKIGADTSLNIVDAEAVNLVRWDDLPDTLPAGVLAGTRTWAAECEDVAERNFVIYDIDFSFGNSILWNYDTTANSPNKMDFFSIAIHEIGHAHALGHIIENTEVMDYNIALGQRNAALTPRAIEAALWVMDSSTVVRGNCPAPMVPVSPADCGILPVSPQSLPASLMMLFPNPAWDMVHVQFIGGGRPGSLDLMLMDAEGNSIPSSRYLVQTTGLNTWKVILRDVPAGLYFLRIQSGAESNTQKIIVLR